MSLEAAPIGWQLFVRSSSLRDQSASLTTFETFATRLLAQALKSGFVQHDFTAYHCH